MITASDESLSPNTENVALSVMNVHRAGHSYIGRIDLATVEAQALVQLDRAPIAHPQWCLIMDNSASMGRWSATLINDVFPRMLDRLGVPDHEEMRLILFTCGVRVYKVHGASGLRNFSPPSQGSTQMRGVFPLLVSELTPGRPTNILVVSDGAVHDQEASVAAASAIANELAAQMPIVNARAIRLVTSSSAQPDTRALAAVLQYNTEAAAASISDLDVYRSADIEMAAAQMASLFEDVSNASALKLTVEPPVLRLQPWDIDAVASVYLKPAAANTLFLTAPPTSVTLNGSPIAVKPAAEVTVDTLATILGDRVDAFLSKLRVLKVVSSAQASDEIQRIVSFWETFEASLAPPEDIAPLLAAGGLRARRKYLAASTQRKLKSLTNMMRAIANDDRVGRLNASQQADYLRTTQAGTKNARGLAKRAEASGLDFDAAVRAEIKAMAAHLHELDALDDSAWSVSFYSQSTTLDGLKEVCELVNDAAFDSLLAVELLELVNLVGVPLAAPIGDFPDPMTYRVDALLPGACVSVADLTVAEKGRGGARLLHPTSRQPIVNAVPLFEDARLQAFLQRHAPTTLECVASVGMRRMICEVPKTLPYTICAAIWQLIGAMDADKSHVHVELLSMLVPSYETSLKDQEGKGYFDYLMPHLLKPRHPEGKELFLNFNGCTNMIQPLWRLVCEGEYATLPRILRSLYSFEIYQVVRRKCKNQPEGFAMDSLRRLLGVDVAARGTPLPEPFTRPAELRHCGTPHVDPALFAELKHELSFVHACTLIVPLFKAVREVEPLAAVRAIPPLSEASISEALQLTYDLDTFLLYNLAQGFLFRTKQERIDKESNAPLLPDLGANAGAAGADTVARFLEKQYAADYERRLSALAGQELRTLQEEHCAELLAVPTADAFNSLLQAGLTRGPVHFKIANTNSAGASELHAALLDASVTVPARGQKLWTWLTGTDRHNNPVWNGGNMMRTPLDPLRAALRSLGKGPLLAALEKAYKERRSHVYRGMANRQGHSNEKPSYFAYGHLSLEAFVRTLDLPGWTEYKREHATCCGVADYEGWKPAAVVCQPVAMEIT
mmetsp:Transcript_3701/g.10931  ORF Transcript_3701/g.10931 Transcript_3701/m.10931 type:complete len:1071 (-) Transcript_3701:279-3491(-)